MQYYQKDGGDAAGLKIFVFDFLRSVSVFAE
jgi:hypothetical protein